MYVYMFTVSVPDTYRGQKRTLDPLELEVTNSCELPCIEPGFSARAPSALNH